MTRQGKLLAIYQCSIEAEFRNMAEERQSHEAWLSSTAHYREAKPIVNDSWHLCIQYLKAKIQPSVDHVHSLPADIFQAATVQPTEGDLTRVDPATTAVEGASALQVVPANVPADLVFFDMVNANPQRRAHVPLHHLERSTDDVFVAARRVLFASPDRQRMVLANTGGGSHQKLHLRVLVEKMPTVLHALLRWNLVARSSASTLRLPDEPVAAPLRDGAEEYNPPLLMPNASEFLRTSAAGSAATPSSLALQRPAGDEVAMMRILEQLERLQNQDECRDGVPLDAFPDHHSEEFRQLVAAGNIRVQENEAGTLATTDVTQTKFIVVRAVHQPKPLARFGVWNPQSKLDVIMALRQDGWAAHEARVLVAYKQDGGKLFRQDFRRPCSYFAALALASSIFDKWDRADRAHRQ